MASVRSNHSNTRLLGSSHDMKRSRQHEEGELEMKAPLQEHNHQKYENMNNFTDDPSHQYEDPARFQDDIIKGPKLPTRKQRGTPRKRANGVYESAKRHERQYTDSSSDSSYYGPRRRDPCWQCVRVMVFLVFFLALAALALIGMIVLGHVPIKACASCSTNDGREVVASSRSEHSARIVQELRTNLEELKATLNDKSDIIEGLRKRDVELDERIAELERKLPIMDTRGKRITNLTAVTGPPGPSGFNGSKGPPGSKGLPGKTNFSACSYEHRASVPSTAGASQSVLVLEPKGRKIVAASCSTLGASEYNLSSRQLPDGRRNYKCECRGKSTLFKDDGARAGSYCYIHFWTCPI